MAKTSNAMRIANKLAKQGQFNPATASKKQRNLVHQLMHALKSTLGAKQ